MGIKETSKEIRRCLYLIQRFCIRNTLKIATTVRIMVINRGTPADLKCALKMLEPSSFTALGAPSAEHSAGGLPDTANTPARVAPSRLSIRLQ